MSSEISTPAVYEPLDLTEMHLRALGSIGLEGFTDADAASPALVKFLNHQYKVALVEIRELKSSNAGLVREDRRLSKVIEELRVKHAGDIGEAYGKSKFLLLDIPISYLGGYAINILSANPTSGIGWFLIAISLITLYILRADDIVSAFQSRAKPKVNTGVGE